MVEGCGAPRGGALRAGHYIVIGEAWVGHTGRNAIRGFEDAVLNTVCTACRGSVSSVSGCLDGGKGGQT